MTDLDIRHPVPPPSGPLMLNTLDDMKQWAEVFIKSGYFKDVQAISQACVRIAWGRELGLPPIASMENIDIVQGRLRLRSKALAALLRQHHAYDYTVDEITSERCTVTITRGGTKLGSYTYTLEMARVAGLATKDVWKSHPDKMLAARAMSGAVGLYAPDVTHGTVYVEGEGPDEPEQDVTIPSYASAVANGEREVVIDVTPSDSHQRAEARTPTTERDPAGAVAHRAEAADGQRVGLESGEQKPAVEQQENAPGSATTDTPPERLRPDETLATAIQRQITTEGVLTDDEGRWLKGWLEASGCKTYADAAAAIGEPARDLSAWIARRRSERSENPAPQTPAPDAPAGEVQPPTTPSSVAAPSPAAAQAERDRERIAPAPIHKPPFSKRDPTPDDVKTWIQAASPTEKERIKAVAENYGIGNLRASALLKAIGPDTIGDVFADLSDANQPAGVIDPPVVHLTPKQQEQADAFQRDIDTGRLEDPNTFASSSAEHEALFADPDIARSSSGYDR